MTGERVFSGILDCFGRSSLAMTGERVSTGVLDCFGRASLAMTTYGKNNCQLNKNHSLSYNQMNHSSDKMTTYGKHQQQKQREQQNQQNNNRDAACHVSTISFYLFSLVQKI
jgi:hypothetical protein